MRSIDVRVERPVRLGREVEERSNRMTYFGVLNLTYWYAH
jgi:hypothetical protein